MTAREGAGCLIVLLAGCQVRPPDVGASAYVFVEVPVPPSQAKPSAFRAIDTPSVSEQFREAIPFGKLPPPVYPPKALAARAGRVIVGVHLTVDASGRVIDVGSSVVAFSTPGPLAEDFFRAVETAVRQWRFRPAAIEHIEYVPPSPGLDAYSRVLSSESIETHFDLSFTFTESGAVQGGPGK